MLVTHGQVDRLDRIVNIGLDFGGRLGPERVGWTAMGGWTPDELRRIGAREEIEIAPRRTDGSLGKGVVIWVVPHDGRLYVRSWKGPDAGWYRAAAGSGQGRILAGELERDVRLVEPADGLEEAVDAGYRSKYRAHDEGYVRDMLAPLARSATREMLPL